MRTARSSLGRENSTSQRKSPGDSQMLTTTPRSPRRSSRSGTSSLRRTTASMCAACMVGFPERTTGPGNRIAWFTEGERCGFGNPRTDRGAFGSGGVVRRAGAWRRGHFLPAMHTRPSSVSVWARQSWQAPYPAASGLLGSWRLMRSNAIGVPIRCSSVTCYKSITCALKGRMDGETRFHIRRIFVFLALNIRPPLAMVEP